MKYNMLVVVLFHGMEEVRSSTLLCSTKLSSIFSIHHLQRILQLIPFAVLRGNNPILKVG